MRVLARTMLVGAGVLILGMWFLVATDDILADEKGGPLDSVQKLAEAIEKGDTAEAKKLVEAIAKSDTEEVMNLMGKRGGKKKAFGVGHTPGAITPDGIELKIGALSKKTPTGAQLEKESKALVEMAYRVAAIADVAKAKVPEKDDGDKKKKDWLEYAESMRKSADELAEAAKDKKAPEIKKAAANVNSACNNCHGKFRD